MIDHFMYGVPDLDEGLRWAEATFGVAAIRGGSHPTLGTCNALISLGSTYLEIIAPDPAQKLDGTFGSRLALLKEGGLITWAARGDLLRTRQMLGERGIASAGPVPTQRRTPEGQLLEWELLFPRQHDFGGLFPFFIDWLQCAHPSVTSPLAGESVRFEISLPDAEKYVGAIRDLADDVSVHGGESGMRVEIDVRVRSGCVELLATPQTLAMRVFA